MTKNNTPGITEAIYPFTMDTSKTVTKAPAINIKMVAGPIMVETIKEPWERWNNIIAVVELEIGKFTTFPFTIKWAYFMKTLKATSQNFYSDN